MYMSIRWWTYIVQVHKVNIIIINKGTGGDRGAGSTGGDKVYMYIYIYTYTYIYVYMYI
jgi:hypothetical protein